MEEFLPNFKILRSSSNLKGRRKGEIEDFYYQILADRNNDGYVQLVDKAGKVVDLDYHAYSGRNFNILRTISNVKEEIDMEISWEEEDKLIYFKRVPQLLFMILQCDNVVNEKMEPISHVDHTAKLVLSITTKESVCTPSLEIDCGGEVVSGTFFLLSDTYVMAGDKIYTIESIGENYNLLPFFISPFHERDLEKYFSVFYSYMENIVPKYENYELEYSDDYIHTQPTIIFKKIDSDKSLYLKYEQSLSNLDFEFLSKYDVVYVATFTLENKILLRRLERQTNDKAMAKLRAYIAKFAPTKSDLKELIETGDNEFILNQNLASSFLLNGLPDLVREYQLLGAEKLVGYKIKPVVPKLNLNIGTGIDFFEGDANVVLGDQTMSLSSFLNDYNKNKYVQLNDGNKAIIDEGYVKKLERLFAKSTKKGKVKISFFDLPEIESLLQERMEGEVFEHHRKIYEGFNKLADVKFKAKTVKAKLRPYQEEGVKWINYLYENNLGGCLADDMGLGKTLQTITMLSLIYPKTKTPTLVVMPRSLLFNWNAELQKFAPQLKAYTYYGTTRDIEEAMKNQIILTTYAIVRNDIETFKDQSFNYIILDESQNIKNVSAQTTQAVNLLKAKHRLALSGTPIENNLTELYSLFRFLNPAMFGSLEDFNRKYTYPIQKGNDKDVMASLRRKIFPFMLRRLKKDVLTELPDRIDQMLYVEMEQEHAKLYEKKRMQFAESVKSQIAAGGVEKAQFIMFQALNELRRLASVPESLTDNRVESPKIPVLIDTLADAVSNGHKVVVFFNYIAGIELVGEKLDAAGIDYTCMTGSTNDRQGVVNRFQNDPKCKVLLMTLKTGGVGLNLTAADMVFIFEPWWNKAAEEQAINRLHRFGQTSKVISYSILTKGTIEEKIALLQQQKAELFAGLIGNDTTSTKHLSEEDIKFILE